MVQLALSFDPPQFDTIMDCIRHVVETCGRQPKAVAADLDLSPSQFSMMLNGYDSRHFPIDKLQGLIRACGPRGQVIVHYLVDAHLTPEETRIERAAATVEAFQKALPDLRKALDVLEGKGRGR